jgi:antitoxin (DNA-binding transcriptional repressor) of toxin-antitoxin stability system
LLPRASIEQRPTEHRPLAERLTELSTVNGLVARSPLHAARLSHLADQAAKGKRVIIAKSGIPMAKLVPLDEGQRRKFRFGTLKGVLSEEVVAAIGAAARRGPREDAGRADLLR